MHFEICKRHNGDFFVFNACFNVHVCVIFPGTADGILHKWFRLIYFIYIQYVLDIRRVLHNKREGTSFTILSLSHQDNHIPSPTVVGVVADSSNLLVGAKGDT